MAIPTSLLSPSTPFSFLKPTKTLKISYPLSKNSIFTKPIFNYSELHNKITTLAVLGAGFGLKPQKNSYPLFKNSIFTKPIFNYSDLHNKITTLAVLGVGFGLKPTKTSKNSYPLSKNSIFTKPIVDYSNKITTLAILGAGFGMTIVGPAFAADVALGEPSNALSLPTWAIHVSSVVEWVSAMVLVWQYGEKSGYESWKGLSWGMVPLLGGALCACTWHFFYNSEDLEVLVALQAALTVIGNATMCLAALRIYKATQESANDS